MNFNFPQMYSEIDTSFNIMNATLIPLRFFLKSLNIKVPHYEKLFKGEEYTFFFYIMATRLLDKLQVKGPITSSKSRLVEFFVDIPYRKFTNYADEIDYVLENLAIGIITILKKYKADPSGVHEAINMIKDMVRDNTRKYNKNPKDSDEARRKFEEMVKSNPDKFQHLFPDLFTAKS